jgi:hypothetical protein
MGTFRPFRDVRFYLAIIMIIGMATSGCIVREAPRHRSPGDYQLGKIKPAKVAADLSVSPASYSGKCPAFIKFKGTISVNRPTTVEYKFIRSDNANAPVQILTFKKAGTKKVKTTWQLGGPSHRAYKGWEAIEILSPVHMRSNPAHFKVRCKADRPQYNKRLPDLTIADITLNKQCFVVVHAKNNGPGNVPKKVWTSQTPDSSSIYLYINGKKWGGKTIWNFDTDRDLRNPDGTAVMTSNLQVSKTATIKAVIDHTNKVVEKNEKNNAMKKTLTCKRFRERRRDRTDRPRPRIRPGDVSRPEAGPEDCISFNQKTAKVKQIQGKWKIVDGSHWMFDFGSNKREAKKALKIIKKHQMNQSCFVGRPNPSFQYMLSGGSAPSGAIAGEDCVSFNPQTATVKQVQGKWKIVDGSHWMFDFGSSKSEARKSLAIIKKYGFSKSCFVGRPEPSFLYLRK